MPDESPTVWNPSDNSDATLSYGTFPLVGNLSAAFQTTPNAFHSVRTNTSKSSGKWMFVCQIASIDFSSGWIIGVANSQAPLLAACGSLQNGAGAEFSLNTSQLMTYGVSTKIYRLISATRDRIGVALDTDDGFIWWSNLTRRSGWTNADKRDFSGDPARGIGGTKLGWTISAQYPAYIMASGYYGNNVPDTFKLNPQCYGYSQDIPTFYTSWDPLTVGYTVGQPC